MIYNWNGKIFKNGQLEVAVDSRALHFGDGLFETMRFTRGKLLFWEQHYFRLMAGMRILRMDIPMNFAPDYLEEQILALLKAQEREQSARVKLSVFRKAGGKYTPLSNDIDFLISAEAGPNDLYQLNEAGLNVDLYKDFYKTSGLLSNQKLTAATIYTLASIYRGENAYDECLLLNEKKEVIEAISANIFLRKGEELWTPPLESGCLKGVMRKQIIDLAPALGLELIEKAFSPFEIQRADELILSNVIKGPQWVAAYRKKRFAKPETTPALIEKLNQRIILGD